MVLEGKTAFDIKTSSLIISSTGKRRFFWVAKRLFDIIVSLLLLPLLATFAIILLILNPWLNSGPLGFVQIRMGRGCKAFVVFKFRSMQCRGKACRGLNEPIEATRITRLGNFMRKTRIDELPQILNVLRGEMSLIGPRPDAFSHARKFVRLIPEYRTRHHVRPGISGLAQVDLGYAVGLEATRQKTRVDIHYIENAGFRLDATLVIRTITTILSKAGA